MQEKNTSKEKKISTKRKKSTHQYLSAEREKHHILFHHTKKMRYRGYLTIEREQQHVTCFIIEGKKKNTRENSIIR
jgi:hypothetical protein